LNGQIARDFGLGYAPEGWRSLASAFARYDDPQLAEAGLVIVQGEDGPEQKRYDRFRDRIMFPIRSVKGELIGFGGRVIDQGEPKYLNSPETPVFVKGRELYGLFEARQAIRERGYALVVEGYMDVVALAQSGFGNAVATLGTACTPEHVQKLLRFTDNVVFSFDGDAAGRRAAGRALEAALPHVSDMRSFKFLFLPAEHDPDSYVREHGAPAFDSFVAAAIPLSRQLVERACEGTDLASAEGRARMLAQARPLWAELPAGALRSQIMADLAIAGRMPPEELAQLWGQQRPAAPGTAPAPGKRPPARLGAQVAARLPQDNAACMLLQRGEWWHELGSAEHDLLTGLQSWHGELFRWLERDLTEHGPRAWPELREEVAAQPWGDTVRRLIDGAVVPVVPALDDLRFALAQMSRALGARDHDRVLGRR
jgi:DNA primase